MKPRILSTARLSFPLATAIAALLAVESVSATTYYWDNNGTTAGFGTAAGTWAAPTTGDATQGWSTSGTGALLPGSITTANTNATTDALNFGNTTTGLAAGTINVSGTVNAGAITFAAGSGPITLSGGTISLFGSATPLTFNSSGHTIGSALTLNGVSTFTTSGASSVNLNGEIGGTGGLNIASTGSVTVTYNLGAANNYSGDTSITTVSANANSGSSNIVILGVADALPTNTVLTMAGQNGAGSGRTVRLDLNGYNQTLAGLTNVTGKSLRNQQVTNTGTLATLTVNNSSDFSYGGTVNGTTVTTSTIDGAIALTKQGTGTLTLTGAANSYTGATKISGGILSLGHIQSLQNSALDTLGSIAGDATNGLRATVTSLSLAGLTGNKDLASVFTTTGGYSGSLAALTFNPGTGVNLSYSGAIADGATGMTLTKSGLGTQILSGANTFSGDTTLNAGKLTGVVGGSFANSTVVLNSTTATSGVSITDNTKSWTNANLTTAAAGTLEFDFGSVSPSATVAPLVVTGDATFTETPGVSIVGSNLAVGSFPLMTWANTSGSAPTVASMPPGFSGSLSISGNTLYLDITTPTFKANNANNLNDPLSWTNGVPSPSQSAIWDNPPVAAANTCDLGGDLTWAGISILNPGGLVTINGSNTLTLGAAAKDIDLSAATADLTVNTALAMGAANTWDVATGRTLTLSNEVAGSFPITKQGPGTVVLSGINTYDVQTTLTEGTLSVSDEDNLGGLSAPLILDGGILRITGTTMTSLARSLNFTSGKNVTLDIADVGNTFMVTQNLTQGSGGFTKLGAGTAVLSGSDTFTGMLTVNAGTLNLTTNRTGTLPPVTVSGSSAVLGFGANYNLGTQSLSVSSGGTVNHTAGSVTSFNSGSAIGVNTGIYNLSGGGTQYYQSDLSHHGADPWRVQRCDSHLQSERYRCIDHGHQLHLANRPLPGQRGCHRHDGELQSEWRDSLHPDPQDGWKQCHGKCQYDGQSQPLGRHIHHQRLQRTFRG